jgi:flavin-dependent thymidylate synthase
MINDDGLRCPACDSPDPARHPALQFEGEVNLCQDSWHNRGHSAHDLTDGAYLPTVAMDPGYPQLPLLVVDGQGREVSRWADSAMFRSEPMPTNERGKVTPRAYLLNATPDPLGSLAALNAIYTGEVVRNLSQVTDPERRTALEEVRKNKLQGPLEVIQFHFMLEGVSRAFTHQIVRGRHAFYAQESLRFAVVEGDAWMDRVALPPGYELGWTEGQREEWDAAVIQSEEGYNSLVNSGIPAEDARGLMPHAMTTRIHWVCSLRELLYVAGVRLCTQAQFEWRTAMASVVQALRERSGYAPNAAGRATYLRPRFDGWQFEAIADLMRPICYQEGACGFKAKADRSCTIRERVDFREKHSLDRKDSSNWHKPMIADVVKYSEAGSRHEAEFGHAYIETVTSPGIDPAEWLADPNAAR